MSKPYSQYTIDSSSRIKRFTHQARFRKVWKLCEPLQPSSILDVGTGDAWFLKFVSEKYNKPVILDAIEPDDDCFREARVMMSQIAGTELHRSWDTVTRKYDVILCQEVFEHLHENQLVFTLEKMRAHLARGGTIIGSVPIETGPAGFMKNMIRLMIGGRHRGSGMKNVIRSALGLHVDRLVQPNGYITSHIGFRLAPLEKAFKESGLKIAGTSYAPFNAGGTWLNSQKIYILKP